MRPRAFVRRKGTRTKQGEVYGFDGGKKVKGTKRHILVDSQGLILAVVVTEANAPERLFAIACLMEDLAELSQLELIWVDGGYTGDNFALEGVTRIRKNLPNQGFRN